MSEKVFRLFLRLYPSRFRHQFGDEALQLFRDRSRDEIGVWPSVRLWLDLLADLAISLPREYRHTETRTGRCFGQGLFGRHADILCVQYRISGTASTATRGTGVADYACFFSQADGRGQQFPTAQRLELCISRSLRKAE